MNKEKYAKQDEQLYYHIKNLQAGNVESYTEIYNLSCKYFYKIIYDIVGDYHPIALDKSSKIDSVYFGYKCPQKHIETIRKIAVKYRTTKPRQA